MKITLEVFGGNELIIEEKEDRLEFVLNGQIVFGIMDTALRMPFGSAAAEVHKFEEFQRKDMSAGLNKIPDLEKDPELTEQNPEIQVAPSLLPSEQIDGLSPLKTWNDGGYEMHEYRGQLEGFDKGCTVRVKEPVDHYWASEAIIKRKSYQEINNKGESYVLDKFCITIHGDILVKTTTGVILRLDSLEKVESKP